MSKIYIVAAKRTAVGSMMGSLKTLSASEMGARVVSQILEDTKVDPKQIDEVIVGNVLSALQGQGVGRQVSIKAGIPDNVPAYSINMVCGSGMKAVINAYQSIKAGLSHLIIAGGTESMTNAPYLIPSTVRGGVKMGDFKTVDHMINDALTDAYTNVHMGITAENVAEKFGITREEQDAFSIASQQKAIKAVDEGKFKDEIVPLVIKEKKNEFVFDTDEYPNRTTSLEKLATLRAAFKSDGTVTAGNASGINDGASFVMVADEEAVKKFNLKPIVEIVGVGQGGVDPQLMGLGPVPAITNALKNCDKTLDEIGLVELNEAFAAQSLGVIKQLVDLHKVDREKLLEKTNVNGGAIALGHPVGASGNRIIVSLIYEMVKRHTDLGLASLCIGGGMGTAIVLKLV